MRRTLSLVAVLAVATLAAARAAPDVPTPVAAPTLTTRPPEIASMASVRVAMQMPLMVLSLERARIEPMQHVRHAAAYDAVLFVAPADLDRPASTTRDVLALDRTRLPDVLSTQPRPPNSDASRAPSVVPLRS